MTHSLNLSFTKIRRVNIDLGTQCNLSCPGCQRTHLESIGKLVPAIMPVSTFAKIASEENNLDAITFSGALSDPIFSTSLFDCLEHVNTLSNRPKCIFSTNGSGRKTEWWEQFASLLVGKNEVGFAIDGLADTNTIYRIGSNFDSIINGIETLKRCFSTNSQNSIVWRYIVFEHNYHQVNEAYRLAKSLGVNDFYLREADPRTPSNMKLVSRKFIDIKREMESLQ
jgi:sulfatase maturation enzyme AslB (radical SAM superfamily)